MFKSLKWLESYEYGAASVKNFIINRLVTLATDILVAVTAVMGWMAISYLYTLARYALETVG